MCLTFLTRPMKPQARLASSRGALSGSSRSKQPSRDNYWGMKQPLPLSDTSSRGTRATRHLASTPSTTPSMQLQKHASYDRKKNISTGQEVCSHKLSTKRLVTSAQAPRSKIQRRSQKLHNRWRILMQNMKMEHRKK
jgi:hypothetical protein